MRTSEESSHLWFHYPGGRDTLICEQPEATPASYTVLNFEVDDIASASRIYPEPRREIQKPACQQTAG